MRNSGDGLSSEDTMVVSVGVPGGAALGPSSDTLELSLCWRYCIYADSLALIGWTRLLGTESLSWLSQAGLGDVGASVFFLLEVLLRNSGHLVIGAHHILPWFHHSCLFHGICLLMPLPRYLTSTLIKLWLCPPRIQRQGKSQGQGT